MTAPGFELTTLIFSNSFRCGVFFAGENLGDKPRETVFIVPKRFEADCSKPDAEKFKKFCFDLVSLESGQEPLWS